MAPAAARSMTSTASIARSAYQAGSARCRWRPQGAAAGVGNVAKTGARAAGQKVADGARSMKERMAAALGLTTRRHPAPSAGPDAAGSSPPVEQPAWASACIAQAATHPRRDDSRPHAARGDGGSSSQGPSLRDSDS